MADEPPHPPAVKPEGGPGASAQGGLPGEDPSFITLKVQNQDNTVIQFKTKKTTALKKLMKAFAERQHVDVTHVRFTFDGVRVQESDTPEDLGMEDGDTIDVFVEAIGGGL